MNMTQRAEQIAVAALAPGERLVWAGGPDADVMLRVRRRRRLIWQGLGLVAAALAVAAVAASGLVDASLPAVLSWDRVREPAVLLPVAAVVFGMPLFSYLSFHRFRRYARSLSYAITDRRLLVFEHGKIVDDFPPERLGQITIWRRGPAHGDVVFGRHYEADSKRNTTGRRDPLIIERDRVGFKALSDPEQMKARILAWREEHRKSAVLEVAGAATALDMEPVAGRPAGRSAEAASAAEHALRRIDNARLGVSITFPATWQIQVRRKKKPRGRLFLDAEHWQEPETAGDWDVLRGVGRMHCSVEVEVFETPPTVTFERMLKERFAASVAGPVSHSESRLEIGGVPGFSVTRRRERLMDAATRQAVVGATAVLERHLVLHDGRRQVYIVSQWPEDSPELGRIVDAVVGSARL